MLIALIPRCAKITQNCITERLLLKLIFLSGAICPESIEYQLIAYKNIRLNYLIILRSHQQKFYGGSHSRVQIDQIPDGGGYLFFNLADISFTSKSEMGHLSRPSVVGLAHISTSVFIGAPALWPPV